ncbi:MAG: glycosyltransferase family 2 protein [Pseudomonadota bacterium]
MVKVTLFLGPDPVTAAQLHGLMKAQSGALRARGILVPDALGRGLHTKLALAALDDDHIHPLRVARGLVSEDAHAAFRQSVTKKLRDEIRAADATEVWFVCDVAARDLRSATEIGRLFMLLCKFGTPQALGVQPNRAASLIHHWEDQVTWGRTTPLEPDLSCFHSGEPPLKQPKGQHAFAELESAPHWLDPSGLNELWEPEFGELKWFGSLGDLTAELDLPCAFPKPRMRPSAQTMARALALNTRLRLFQQKGGTLSRKHRAKIMAELAVDGPALNVAPVQRMLKCPEILEPLLPPLKDFDPDKVFAALVPRMVRWMEQSDLGSVDTTVSKQVAKTRRRLLRSRHAPHNRTAPAQSTDAPFTVAAERHPSSPKRVVIACMKNEGPYLLEWLAFHRALGFEHFVVFTNDCEDGTDRLLDLIAPQGWLTHVDNSTWRGKSPQQAALNRAIKMDVVRRAEWVLHIDCDEFVNIRCGNGTLDDLFDACPEATHFTLTWRMFGSAGVKAIQDRPVIEQFTRCAPAFCPKPHTNWGFKTLGKQVGAYGKLSCHRPTKPVEPNVREVHWVNGSGRTVTQDFATKGWRSNITTIGYDLVQLNHYALRSRDAYLVKRARGRALHVDRTIGKNYWLRMDWNDWEDRSAIRHLPRVNALLSEWKADPAVNQAHRAALVWHQTKAAAMKEDPDVQDLIKTIETLDMPQSDRAAHALCLDMES